MSPFARRIAIWCALQGREVERRRILVSGDDFVRLKGVNPVGRVPALVTDDGETLIETWTIIDWLEETAPEGERLIPASGLARRTMLQDMAYGNSAVEKGVALVYDKNRRPAEYHWADWQARLEGQIAGALDAIEARCPDDGFKAGDRPGGGDVAFVVAHDFIAATNPYLLEGKCPKLKALAARARDLPAFAETMPET